MHWSIPWHKRPTRSTLERRLCTRTWAASTSPSIFRHSTQVICDSHGTNPCCIDYTKLIILRAVNLLDYSKIFIVILSLTSNSNSRQGIHFDRRRYSTSLSNCSLLRSGRYERVSNFFFPIGGQTCNYH